MPEPSRKAAKECASMYKKGCDDYRKLLDDNYRKIGMFFQEKTQESK
jgi:hypothetical protein